MAPKNAFAEIEERLEKSWRADRIFEQSVEREAPQGDYVFYDGPPFATGTPHYGHFPSSLLKDVVPRYWTMQGYRVRRRWGWDCHGLPIENIVEKELKIKHKKDIEAVIGVGKFNEICRSKVLTYADEWRQVIRRIGRWVDMDHPYRTMDVEYMESIWWVFKQLWDKGLIYQGYRAMHICPRCETTLSQSEVTEGYKDVEDVSVTLKFKLIDQPDTYILTWTTTPWTLPGNVALAVGADVEYVQVKVGDNHLILAAAAMAGVLAGQQYKEEKKLTGQDLVGLAYEPLFPYFDTAKNREKGFKVYAADFVTTQDGTGIVHIAPGFGEDDMNLGKQLGLPMIQHVGLDGLFTADVTDFAGQAVKSKAAPTATDEAVVAWLAEHGKVFATTRYTHSYPHCYRCDTPLLNYATSSWFVNVTKIKPRALELVKTIHWVPEHIKEGRFGNWLEGARDWSISRQRYWGSVMPIWQCDQCSRQQVFGSRAELEKASGVAPDDLHKHIVDPITFACGGSCAGTMRRIPDVLDCWFESGSMPYAQLHYPFENKELFEKNFPAQFIAEGSDQCRAWFYYLIILSVALFDKVAFQNVIVNGIVLAEDGQKMAKRLKNYPDPMAVIERWSADALRYCLITSPVMKADTLNFSEKGVEEV
ncbi:MAG: isoleucine--tRNA ligase, partial [Patescibacteria group bacterium]